tara:strand:- start:14249 stop:14404 length:156 start_codon:yes stop_codon:yes gene_type:complete
MYGDVVDMDLLSYLLWIYYMPFEIFVFMFSLGFWGTIAYFIYRGFRDFFNR